MTALPIVRRELLVAGRRSWTYWNRCLGALVLLAIGATVAASSGTSGIARVAFLLMGSTALAGALLSGVLLNADRLAAERKAGTLGLLFLTQLTGIDVALGMLVASTVQGGCALLAMLPVLAIPLMAGGVAFADFWCCALVLVATLLCSAGIGLWASSRSSDVVPAYSLAILALAALCLVPILVSWAARKFGFDFPALATFELLSPAVGFNRAINAGAASTGSARAAALSAISIAGIGVAAVARAGWTLQRTGRAGLRSRAKPTAMGVDTSGFLSRRSGRRLPARADAAGHYRWLYSARLPAMRALDIASVLGGIALISFLGVSLTSAGRNHGPFIVAMLIAYGLHVVFKIRVALAALGPWLEDLSGGGLELLLTTPLTSDAVRCGHRQAVDSSASHIRWWLVVANMVVWLVSLHPSTDATGRGIRTIFGSMYFGGIASLWADPYCIRNNAMLLSIKGRRLGQLLARVLLPVVLPPWIAALAIFILGQTPIPENKLAGWFVLVQVVQIVWVIVWGNRASRILGSGFRVLVLSR